MSTNSKIDLGFVDPFEQPWKSKCKYFPSKAGGKPSFLCLNPVLDSDKVSCPKCTNVMKFLLQIYAPIDDNDNAFHRTLFLFGCDHGCNEFMVYRTQLSHENRFYSSVPPDYDSSFEKDPSYNPNPEAFDVKLCFVCGIEGKKQCSQCRNVNYCSKEHQVVHWKSGHKNQCQNIQDSQPEVENNCLSSFLFPEYELIIEPFEQNNENNDDDDDDDDDGEEIQEREMFKYKEYLAANKPTMQNENVEEYDKEEEEKEQKVFENFKKSTKEGEVLRYRSDWYKDDESSDDDILWISSRNMPPKVIPLCDSCQSKRKFEFQITPYLLNKFLTNHSDKDIDWGTILIYSCPNSCPSNGYLKEFVFNQVIV